MNRKIENILLGVLWLLGATLGTCFWFNTRFGFNLFSSAHWEYLAMQQATRAPISFWFYFSFVAATFITLFGLYLLIRPRLRKINFSKPTLHIPQQTTTSVANQQATVQPVVTPVAEPQTTQSSQPTLTRPPRLNIAPSNTFAPAPQTPVANAPVQHTPQTAQQSTQDGEKLREIFSLAHYIIKKEPRINGIQMSVLAIGTDEVLYLGATDISTQQMNYCADKLSQVFSDTLDGVEIHINPFVLRPTDSPTPSDTDILTFDTLSSVRDYMKEHTNPPLPADDDGNFDAYSDYISTVIDYIGKL